ncbi:MAG: cell division protein FtsZ [Chloroflexota bacterium]|nr:cell division protein FtsZ [Chloroflexota bacterium]
MAKPGFVPNPAKIKVLGLGGGGCNAVSRMVRADIQGVDFIGVNTDAQALLRMEAPTRIQVGEKLTRGLGVGGDHNLGGKAAEQSRDELRAAVADSDMVFLTAGMGGGSGTGIGPITAELAKEAGALTIAVVTKPFAFEGVHRMEVAEEGIERLIDKVDTLITIPNDRLLTLCDQRTGVDNAFKMADDVLMHAVQAIAEVITVPGMINLDFADVKAVMKDAGQAWMSIGMGSGQHRANDAAQSALASPLLDVSVDGAKGVLFNITGGESLTLFEVNEAAEVIRKAVDPESNIIFGVTFDPALEGELRMTLIATGFNAAYKSGKGLLKDEELRRLVQGTDGEAELDIPTFLRSPMAKRQMAETPPPEPKKSMFRLRNSAR